MTVILHVINFKKYFYSFLKYDHENPFFYPKTILGY